MSPEDCDNFEVNAPQNMKVVGNDEPLIVLDDPHDGVNDDVTNDVVVKIESEPLIPLPEDPTERLMYVTFLTTV